MALNPYDQLSYPMGSHPAVHVRKLEAAATLFGMHPQPVSQCRVLELGCAAACNLIPQSMEFPESEFIGVDLSARQIDHGRSLIATLGLQNIVLRHADLLDIDDSWGQFDYILCHGVYSWVPEHVRERVLAICKNALAPNGVALVSYNVLPGWRIRGVIRDMMLYHVSQIEQPDERISQSRAVVAFMAENCSADTAYGQVLKEESDRLKNSHDHYLFHEHLEDENYPIYFHQFIEHAEADGLRYLANSDVASMFPRNLPPKARQVLASLPPIKQQQYMDFLSNRKFRSTLLCHQGIEVNWTIRPEVLRKFQLSLIERPQPFEPSFDSNQPLTVRIGPSVLTIHSPLAMAAIEHLSDCWPRSVTIDELREASIRRLATKSHSGESFDHVSADDVAHAVADIFLIGLIEFCLHPAPIANRVSSQPVATPLARLQASSGGTVTNQRHENVGLDEFNRYLIALLDSHHDRTRLSEKIQKAIAEGELAMPGAPKQVYSVSPQGMGGLVDNALTKLCNASLLTS